MSGRGSAVTLRRECKALTVPAGQPVVLPEGDEVEIVQRLGGSITVRSGYGLLLRIDAADADALGIEAPTGDGSSGATDAADAVGAVGDPGSFELSRVYQALDQVYDPEIPVSIVELGLVYRCEELPAPHGGRRIEVDMSMTAPGCGMGDVLRDEASRAVLAVPGVEEVEVNLVWDPPWTIHRMSDAARLQLGLL